jgi:hypothetical protein
MTFEVKFYIIKAFYNKEKRKAARRKTNIPRRMNITSTVSYLTGNIVLDFFWGCGGSTEG